MAWSTIEQAMSPERTIELTSSLIKAKSEAGAAHAGGVWMAQHLSDLGFEVEALSIEGFAGGPLIVGSREFGTGGGGVMFDAHHDTDPVRNDSDWSFSPFSGEVRDGFVHGRGAVDSKGAAAAMLAACEGIIRSGVELAGKIVYSSPSDGELAMRGGDLIADGGYLDGIDVILSAEATSCKTVEVAYPGLSVWKIDVIGRAAHPTQPEHGVDAIAKMAEIVRAVSAGELQFKHDQWDWMDPRVTVNAIRSVPKGWEVPDNCSLVLNVLSVPGMTPDTIRRDIVAFLDSLQARDPELKAKVKIVPRGFYVWRRPLEVEPDHQSVATLIRAAKEVVGRTVEAAPFLGGYVPGAASATINDRTSRFARPACLTFGPGDFSLAHAPDEKVSVTELHDSALTYARFLFEYLS